MIKRHRNSLYLLLILTFSVFIAGCSKRDKNLNTVTIKGSDTMVHLVSTWAEAFMTANPEMQVSVTGGGSGTGIAALLNGTTDIAASSRDIKVKEIDLAKSKGLDIFQTPVALDGIAVVVNSANTVSELSLLQLKGIFTGETTNWSEVGGSDGKIVILSRESNSGTFVFFQEFVLEKQDFSASSLLMPSSSSIIQGVADGETAIGYVGLGFATHAGENVKTLMVKIGDSGVAVRPSVDTVMDGSYPIARNLFFFVDGEPIGAVKTFSDYILSEAGQQVVKEIGYVPISRMEVMEVMEEIQ